MRTKLLLIPALSLAMLTGSAAAIAQYGPPPPPPGQGYGPGPGGPGGWDNAPPEFREIQQRGFHDGIEGARKDFENHRRPTVNNRDEFRRPPVAGPDRRAYRQAFRRGYDVGVQHIYGGGPR